MRLVIYLFSFWLLLLAGLPCPDADCHIHENRTASTSTSQPAGHDHDHNEGHEAPCSPFCHCATCLGFSVPQPFNYLRPADSVESTPARQVFTYRSPGQFDVMLGIWQPPKLRV